MEILAEQAAVNGPYGQNHHDELHQDPADTEHGTPEAKSEILNPQPPPNPPQLHGGQCIAEARHGGPVRRPHFIPLRSARTILRPHHVPSASVTECSTHMLITRIRTL